MDGLPKMVLGIGMYVMMSQAFEPASWPEKAPIDWIPSWEFPARRMTALRILLELRAVVCDMRVFVGVAEHLKE